MDKQLTYDSKSTSPSKNIDHKVNMTQPRGFFFTSCCTFAKETDSELITDQYRPMISNRTTSNSAHISLNELAKSGSSFGSARKIDSELLAEHIIDHNTNTIKHYESESKSDKFEIINLQQSYAELEAENNKLKSVNGFLLLKIKDVEKNEAKKDEIPSWKMNPEVLKINAENEKLQSKNMVLRNALKEREDEIKNLASAHDSLIQVKNNIITSIMEEKDSKLLQSQIEEKETNIKDLNNKIKRIENEKVKTKKDAAADLEKLKLELNQVKNENAEKEEKFRIYSKSLQQKEEQIQKYVEEEKKPKDKNLLLKTEKSGKEEKLKSSKTIQDLIKKNTEEKLKTDIKNEQSRVELNEKEDKIINLTKTLKQKEDIIKKNNDDVKILRIKLIEKEDIINKINEEYKSLTSNIKSNPEDTKKHEASLTEKINELKKSEDQNKKLNDKYKALEKQLINHENNIKSLHSNITSLQVFSYLCFYLYLLCRLLSY